MTVPILLLALLALAALGLAAWRLGGQEPQAVAAVRAWGAGRGHRVREAPAGVEVIGVCEGRLFTVSMSAGPPAVLLIGVDCAAEGAEGADGVAEGAADGAAPPEAARTDDGAFVSRWTNPSPTHLAGLDSLVLAMVRAASDLENGVSPAPAAE